MKSAFNSSVAIALAQALIAILLTNALLAFILF
jgi:hypothetical protein